MTPSNAAVVLEAADFLQLRHLVMVCTRKLQQMIDHSNAVAVEQLATSHLCRGLAAAANEHISTNLQAVVARSVEFAQLSPADRRNYVLNSRQQFTLMEESYPTKSAQLSLRTRSPISEDELNELSTLAASRPTDVIIVVPAETHSHDHFPPDIFYLDPGPPPVWGVLARLPFSDRAFYASAVMDHSTLFVTGGEKCAADSSRYELQSPKYNDVYMHDSLSKRYCPEWYKCAPLLRKRSNHSAVECLGKLYVIGGLAADEGNPLDHIEFYNLETDQWTLAPLVPYLDESQRLQRCATVAVGECIYVVGGWFPVGGLNLVRVFNVTTNQWNVGGEVKCEVIN